MVSEPPSRAPAAAGPAPNPGGDTPSSYGLDQLHWTESGTDSSPPVLLLHGWGSSAQNMAPIEGALSEAYHVVNMDLPGHGHSPVPAEPMGVPEHAALVARFIKERLDGPVTLVGHSNGGRIALYMASDESYRGLVRRMVLISPSGVTPHRSIGYAVRKTVARLLKAPFMALPGRLRAFGLDWLRHSLVWRLLGSSDYRALEGVMRETFVRTVNHHLDERIGRIDVPTLIIWGDGDTAVSKRQMDFLEREIPDAGIVILEGAGHYGYLDDPVTFHAATLHFLENT